jgi:heat shock protein HspQ
MATPPRKRSTALPPVNLDPPQTAATEQAAKKAAARLPVAKPTAAKPSAALPPVLPGAKARKLPPAPSPLETAALAEPKPRKIATKASAKTASVISSTPKAVRQAKFSVGAVVKHRVYPFRGVVFDIDPVFNNTEDWWQAIPEEIRPRKDQPFYHLLAENAETTYVAYVSEQNLLADKTGKPVRHPQVKEMFALDGKGQYRARFLQSH